MRQSALFRAPFCALFALAACAELPAIEDSVSPASQAADFPLLVPLDPLLKDLSVPQTAPDTALRARARALRARAARLRAAQL